MVTAALTVNYSGYDTTTNTYVVPTTLCWETRAAVCDQDFAYFAHLAPQVAQVLQVEMSKITKIAPPPLPPPPRVL